MTKAYLDPEEVKALEDAATNLRDRLLVRVLFHQGCRVSEALGIAVDDVNLAGGTVTIQHLKTRMRLSCPQCDTRLGRSHCFCPKCGSKVEKIVAEEKEHRRMRTLRWTPLLGQGRGHIKSGPCRPQTARC
ncbi:MAG: tyrosine-type recombinase/integrase [Chloroflexota bacterium]